MGWGGEWKKTKKQTQRDLFWLTTLSWSMISWSVACIMVGTYSRCTVVGQNSA